MKWTVQLKLRDGSEQTLNDDAVVAAASKLEDGDSTRLEALVEDRRVEAARLVALAASVGADEIGLSNVQRALHGLHFRLFWGNDEVGDPPPVEESETEQRELPGRVDPLTHTYLTTAMARDLQRHKGEWAAIGQGRLLATARNLHDLQQQVGDADATVLWIPTGRSSEDDAG